MTAIQAGVMARNRTPAALAAQRPQPPRRFTQAELRERPTETRSKSPLSGTSCI